MSRAGDEMILQLASLLGSDTVKTAAKKEKDEDKDEKKEDKKDEKKEDKEEKKEDKKKKAGVMSGVLQDLVKLATELDEMGAEEAAGLVDDAIKTIIDGIDTE